MCNTLAVVWFVGSKTFIAAIDFDFPLRNKESTSLCMVCFEKLEKVEVSHCDRRCSAVALLPGNSNSCKLKASSATFGTVEWKASCYHCSSIVTSVERSSGWKGGRVKLLLVSLISVHIKGFTEASNILQLSFSFKDALMLMLI